MSKPQKYTLQNVKATAVCTDTHDQVGSHKISI